MRKLNSHSVKYILFILIIGAMTTPLIHQATGGTKGPELKGAIDEERYSPFNWNDWFKQDYQVNTQEYLNENFGIRNYFVRFHNQRLYNMYGFAKASGVIIGKDKYLFEFDYIKAHYGLDFVGHDSIQDKSEKLKFIQEKLKSQGKEIIVLFAPGKGSYFSEFIPEKYKPDVDYPNNYEEYTKALKKLDINYLDFKSWFMDMKGNSKYPLYPKCGIHWSKYGEYLAADSLLKHLEFMTQRELPELFLDSIKLEEVNKDGDYDIGEGMNLLMPLNTYPMAYPYYHYKPLPSRKAPKILAVADSYFWGMFNSGMSHDCFDNGQFWFYNQQIFPESFETDLFVYNINIREEVEKNDVIIIITTDATLDEFGFGFIDQLYDAYQNE